MAWYGYAAHQELGQTWKWEVEEVTGAPIALVPFEPKQVVEDVAGPSRGNNFEDVADPLRSNNFKDVAGPSSNNNFDGKALMENADKDITLVDMLFTHTPSLQRKYTC
ncbi:hypothetical protein RJ641_034892 [Dillenia turbinata]|uniref:Uncharacterized protein n=1 Tax=Dillenia turbinata TaxID=194707 RepID=A0AAN8VWD7_9MAGN